VVGSDRPAQALRPTRRRSADGTWVGSLICVPFLLVLGFLAVRTAQHDQWGRLTGLIVIVAIFLSIPAGGAKWLRHVLKERRADGSP
jgi:hypothetical protein